MQSNQSLPQNRAVYRAALLAAMLLLFFAVLHSVLGLNEILSAVRTGDIGRDSAHMITITWLFGGLSLFMMAGWILFISRGLRRLQKSAWWQGLFLSFFLSAFGAGCWFYFPTEGFLLAVLLTGLILLMPLLIYARDYFSIR